MITKDSGNHDSTSSHPPLRPLSASSRTESLPVPNWMTDFRSISGRFSSLEVTGFRLTGRKLGKGSNATVEEVEWQGTFCAAKILHEILLGDDSPGGPQRFVEGFLKECLTWSKLSHPHIVQFLGVYSNPDSAIPILLLEKMDTSLRVFLEENQRDYFLLPDKIFILLQVVQGLVYLHSRNPPLVHHDLSSNNILLNREVLLAKLTDFGMSRVVDPSGASRKSSVKGTLAFMSPEALFEPPHYNEKLDVFSFGNVIITTLTHAWPNPGPFNTYKGNTMIPLNEFKRREKYVNQFIPEESTLFIDMVRSCLENRPNLRPTSLQLVGQMRQIEKDHPRKLTGGPTAIEQLHAQLQEKDTQLQANDTQLQEKDTQLQANDTQLQEKDTQLRESATHIAKLLEENQRFKQESQASSSSPAKPFKPGQTKVFRSDLVRPGEHHSVKMPDLLIPTWLATPVNIGRDVYLVGGFTARVKIAKLVQVYNMDSGECRTLPPSPQFNSAAVAIDGNLVLIGGKSSSTGKFINMVSTWMVAEEQWTKALPPMKMKRHRPGVLLLNNHLFVFGGMGEDKNKSCLDSFEVLDLNTNQWSEGCGSLRQCLSSPRLGVFGDYVMLYGGATSASGVTRVCYTVPVQALVDSATNPLSPPIHWTLVQRAPYYRSSLLTTSHDAVRLIGGADSRDGQATIEIGDRDQQVTRAIHRFSSSGSWEVIGELSEPRSEPTVVAVSDRSFLVLGGCSDPNNTLTSLLESVELISY